MTRGLALALLLPLGLGACAVIPPDGPQVLATPPGGKGMAQFQAEDGNCRNYASAQIGYGPTANPAAAGAATGAAVGANNGNVSSAVLQQRYDIAYAQCMASAGNTLQQMPAAMAPAYGGLYPGYDYYYPSPYYAGYYGFAPFAGLGFYRGYYGPGWGGYGRGGYVRGGYGRGNYVRSGGGRSGGHRR